MDLEFIQLYTTLLLFFISVILVPLGIMIFKMMLKINTLEVGHTNIIDDIKELKDKHG